MPQLKSSKLEGLEHSIVFDGNVELDESLSGPSETENPLTALRSVVLLGGSVRLDGFRAAVGRSLLDLPLAFDRTVMDRWMVEIASLRRTAGPVAVRLILDGQAVMPARSSVAGNGILSIERDPFSFRGTGGLLSDLARGYHFEGWMLVINAGQVLRVPLDELYDQLLKTSGVVRLIAEEGARVGGVMLVKCDALRDVPEIGYCDFKEQVLNSLRNQSHLIGVAKLDRPSSFRLRKRSQYLDAVAVEHGSIVGDDVGLDQSAEDWKRRFTIVETSATVHPSALVHDSVVLSGARVGPRAAVIRSVLGPKALIASGQVIRDSVVG